MRRHTHCLGTIRITKQHANMCRCTYSHCTLCHCDLITMKPHPKYMPGAFVEARAHSFSSQRAVRKLAQPSPNHVKNFACMRATYRWPCGETHRNELSWHCC